LSEKKRKEKKIPFRGSYNLPGAKKEGGEIDQKERKKRKGKSSSNEGGVDSRRFILKKLHDLTGEKMRKEKKLRRGRLRLIEGRGIRESSHS